MAEFTLTREQLSALRSNRARWSADAMGNVFDADFTHDAMLKIQGDFKSTIQRRGYAERLAADLNNVDVLREALRMIRDRSTAADPSSVGELHSFAVAALMGDEELNPQSSQCTSQESKP